ncbi:ADP-ribosylglycohydrolase [Paucilactobacillus hokkaidonensis JCM 18461]|uniref:ADP-ribosylglycohydrolase n=2 Tax=Paucilactobacillus hokkaidonensis TaxID=1193095 RepID=A0A0A1GUJ5_9LACO|nr:ADP-ribosylglycohydrolase family protein [Paucilactobacillus hokkaidonensis]KRO09503.1 ADP-ribosylglycohydrolase [Paucilactobacillus hokkaidonensis]BAP84679.1 ADP-ribosylglycohydrolase [Paucilactobacillus hokkaidonensis JCM 18461]
MNAIKMKNTLYAAVIGDALGVPVEMKQRGQYRVSGMTGYGTWGQPAGTWSDDTSLTLCLIQNLVKDDDLDSLMDKFVSYMENAEWTPADEVFDVGNSCSKAIVNYAVNKLPATECGDNSEYGNGNGAIMRLAPLVMTLNDELTIEERFKQYRDYTSLTHRHPRAITGSLIYLEILWYLKQGASLVDAIKSSEDSVDLIGNYSVKYRNEKQSFNRIFDSDFKNLPVSAIRSSGYVVDTLGAAVWIALNSDSYKNAILTAVNLGGDTDTIASITGSIMGFKDAIDIPSEWTEAIVNREYFEKIVNPFVEKYRD